MIYTASLGDTWDSIAYKAFQDEFAFPSILELNRGLADVVEFEGGEKVIIPDTLVIDSTIITSPWQTGAPVRIITTPW
jgi:phage tail protein X